MRPYDETETMLRIAALENANVYIAAHVNIAVQHIVGFAVARVADETTEHLVGAVALANSETPPSLIVGATIPSEVDDEPETVRVLMLGVAEVRQDGSCVAGKFAWVGTDDGVLTDAEQGFYVLSVTEDTAKVWIK